MRTTACKTRPSPDMRHVMHRFPLRQLATQHSPICYATSSNIASRRRRKQETGIATEADAAQADQNPQQLVSKTSNSSTLIQFGEPPSDETIGNVQSWVAFSDLHVSSRTIDTSLEVLQFVHHQAKQKKAGVLFLGDFWDRRGDLPVVPLNKIQDEISSWRVPLLLLPGNHDQVDLGGLDHSLDPIKVAAARAHVFTRPTIFGHSLWLPYRRKEPEIKAAISQALQQQQQQHIKAIFGHADVLTAHMNASYQAREGLPPGLFPSAIPVYLGHYHYPHTVSNTKITYIGSPYQVSSSEAGQQKRLLLLDSNWQQQSEIPIDIGRRFWNFHSSLPATAGGSSSSSEESSSLTDTEGVAVLTEEVGGSILAPSAHFWLQPEIVRSLLERGELRAGDVAHLRVDEENESLKEVQQMLKQHGAEVQLHLHPKAAPAVRIASAEQLTMQQLLEQYAEATNMNQEVLDTARKAIQELGSRSTQTPVRSHLELESVTVEGFGPFKSAVEYQLADRGVVAVTGRNNDDVTAVSNGAGKTSLLTSLLWAFKVDDDRDMITADYVNEDSKRATVTVRGAINQEPFELIRSTTGGSRPRGSLSLVISGEELTGQEQKITDAILKDKFSTNLIPKTLMFTQEGLLGLLQSNDAAFKDLLSSVVDISSWDDARLIASQERSDLTAKVSALSVALDQFERYIQRSEMELNQLMDFVLSWEQQQQQQKVQAEAMAAAALQEVNATAADIHRLRQQITVATAAARTQQQQLAAAVSEATAAAAAAEQQLRLWQQQQQQQEANRFTSCSDEDEMYDDQQQQQQPLLLPVFDEMAAAAALNPLLIHEQEMTDQLMSQQGVTKDLQGQLKAAQQRRHKYEKLQGHGHGDLGSSSSSSSGGGVLVAAAAAADAAVETSRNDARMSGLRPICEQCLQPIDYELYNKNLDIMAAEEQRLLQRIADALQLEQQLAAALAAAREQRVALQQRQEQQRQQVTFNRERIMSEQAAAEKAARHEAEELRKLERHRFEQQQRQQRQLFQEQSQLQWELTSAQHIQQSLESCSAQLESTLTYVAQKLQLPDLLTSSSSSSSGNQPAAAAAVHLFSLESELREDSVRLCQVLSSAADDVITARGVLQQVTGAQNPYLSGVDQARRTLTEQQQQQQESSQQKQQLEHQVKLLKAVQIAFGRTGIPSFLTEGVLSELQAACSRHLSQLAAGMSLELSPTSVKRSAVKKPPLTAAAAAAAAAKKKKKKSKSTAATVTDSLDADLSDAELDNVQNNTNVTEAESDTDLDNEIDSAAAAAAAVKEEISKIIRVRSAGGELKQRSIAQLSGGEKKRVALALGLGFAELVAARGRLTSNVLILDEVLEKLDDEGCACVARLLKGLPYSSVFVVGQAGSFVTKEFAAVDVVVKSGGCSKVELGGMRS